MSSQKPALIIIPGAWHVAAHYIGLHNTLADAGYEVTTLNLPSVGPKEALQDLSADVAVTQQAIQSYISCDLNVVLVMHSFGGLVGSCAAKNYQPKDQANGYGIVSLVYLCAFAPDEGLSLIDANGGKHAPWVNVLDEPTATDPPKYGFVEVPDPAAIFYNDCTPEVQADAMGKLRLQSDSALYSRCTFAAWKEIESNYLVAEFDAAIPPEVQGFMAGQEGGRWKRVERIQSGHSPFLSRLKETVNFVRRCAGEEV